MTNTKSSLASLLLSDDPGEWSEETVWTVFCHIVSQNSPLPGLAENLIEYRAIFHDVFSKIKEEHACSFWRYYRNNQTGALVNPINVEHLTRLLHAFSSRLYKQKAPEAILDSLFFIMRTHCNINLFYRTQEIDFFFPLHAMGSVFGYGEFGSFIVITQHCTIGQNRGKYPSIDGGLWMGPGSSILGASKVGKNVRIAAHAFIIDQNIPDDVIVFGSGNDIFFKENRRDNRSLILDQGY